MVRQNVRFTKSWRQYFTGDVVCFDAALAVTLHRSGIGEPYGPPVMKDAGHNEFLTKASAQKYPTHKKAVAAPKAAEPVPAAPPVEEEKPAPKAAERIEIGSHKKKPKADKPDHSDGIIGRVFGSKPSGK